MTSAPPPTGTPLPQGTEVSQPPRPPLDPAAESRIRDSFGRQGLMRLLGAELTRLSRGQVVIRLPFRDDLTQQLGYFHAGGTSAIADSAGGYAGLTMFPAGTEVLTVEFKINLLAPGRGDYLEATGTVVRSGRTLTVCQIEVDGVSANGRTPVALCQQTLFCVAA